MAIVATLNTDEIAVLTHIAKRLRRGRNVYGALTLSTDQRHFKKEAAEELMDFCVYRACAWLKGQQ
jgi:hypothetical protein